MPGVLIVNPRSGDGGTEELLEGARSRGIDVHVLREGEEPAGAALAAAGGGPLGMAGGDGSLAPVAAVAAERGRPFVCVPFGTRNHFARDLGLDRGDPVGALAAFDDGVERRVDLARANDRPFLNNISLGVYAQLVHRRERHRRRRTAFARARALAIVASKRDAARITVDGSDVTGNVVLVSSNHYALDVLSLGERERLDEGLLHLYVPRGVLRSRWDERTARRFVVGSSAPHVRAAVDGEPALFETPVEVTIEPRALRVLVPRDPIGEHQ